LNDFIYYAVIPLSLLVVLFSTVSVAADSTTNEKTEKIKEQKLIPPKPPIDSQIELKLKTGIMHYEYTDPFYEKLSDNTPFVGGGLVFNLGNFSLDLYAQHTDKGKDGFFEENLARNTNAYFDRNDYAITLNYKIDSMSQYLKKLIKRENQFSVYSGWKWSNTNVNTIDISLGPSGQLVRNEIRFETAGPFFGLANSLALDKKNNHWLGISVVGGRIEGNYDFSGIAGETPYANINTISPANVLRYGVSIQGVLFKLFAGNIPIGQLIYSFSVDHYSYTMDLEGPEFANFSGGSSIEETINSANVSLKWVFRLPSL
jgi:hypothetical protein